MRLYLRGEGREDLVERLAGEGGVEGLGKGEVGVDDIRNLMIGVHLAVLSEAMTFCEKIGVSTDLIYDIVSNAAGSSAAFVKHFAEMQKGKWSLRSVAGVDGIRDRLVSFSFLDRLGLAD